jgi:hypothetical protein
MERLDVIEAKKEEPTTSASEGHSSLEKEESEGEQDRKSVV